MITRQMGEFERWASGIASTAVGSWGMRRGGVVGLLALAGAGFLAWRAGSGHSLLPESGRKLLEKAVPALADESPRKAPGRRRTAAKAKATPTNTRRTAKASTAASRTSGTKAADTPKAAPKSAPAKGEKAVAAKSRAPRRKAPITAANGSETGTPKTIN